MIQNDKGLDDLEDMPEYQVGSWRSPYVKIYSIGGRNRIAEISNYPRAYKDMSSHLYTKDVSFTVVEDDLNYEDEEGRFYMDSKDNLFEVGEEATHWMRDSLPGAFPLWLESEDLPFTSNLDEHVFPIDKVPGPIVDLTEGAEKVGSVFEKLPEEALVNMRDHLHTGNIVRGRQPQDEDKQVIRIRYRRVF